MARTVRSPDGRTWKIDRTSPNSMMGQTAKEPFFWASAVVTVLLIALVVWVIVRGHTAIAIVSGIILLIWVLERGLNVIRPNIQAQTEGPPPETLTWRTTHRYGLGKMEDRIARQIEQGRTEGEPPGTVLIGI
jgi:dolichol kinase